MDRRIPAGHFVFEEISKGADIRAAERMTDQDIGRRDPGIVKQCVEFFGQSLLRTWFRPGSDLPYPARS
jgi:hypothetical protein